MLWARCAVALYQGVGSAADNLILVVVLAHFYSRIVSFSQLSMALSNLRLYCRSHIVQDITPLLCAVINLLLQLE